MGASAGAVARSTVRRTSVVHVQKVNGIGGSERHLLDLLPALARRGVEVRMFAFATPAGAGFVERMRQAGVETMAVDAGPDVNLPGAARLLARLRRLRPDLVHTHLVHGDVHGQLAALGAHVPTISSQHGTPDFYRHVPYRQVGMAIGRTVRWRIAISEHVARFLLELGLARPERLRVIPYGIDPVPWQLAASSAADSRRRFGIEEGKVAIGIAARLVEGKGHARLLEAFQAARAIEPSLLLLVAGTGPLADGLERQAEQCPDVRFTGFVEDVPAFMSACDICVCPTESSLGEGFGLSALEAMAAGRPVVATRVGALSEVVADGESGLVVPAASADRLAAALVRLGRDPALRHRLGAGGADRAATRFSLEQMVHSTMDAYAAAADG